MSHTIESASQSLQTHAQQLGLFGLIAQWDRYGACEWVPKLLDIEQSERTRRSLERRLQNARIGNFKAMVDYDYDWNEKPDRETLEDVLSLECIKDNCNVVLLGPNGVGKTMILKNLAYQAIVAGHTVLFCTASDMLSDLAAQDSSSALARRVRRYTGPRLLCIDEVGYLSYDNRYADLFFEVVSRRYQNNLPIALSTNKPFSEWPQVFPNAACVVTLVDRLMHRCELVEIQADSYRLKEANERATAKARQRASRRKK